MKYGATDYISTKRCRDDAKAWHHIFSGFMARGTWPAEIGALADGRRPSVSQALLTTLAPCQRRYDNAINENRYNNFHAEYRVQITRPHFSIA